nr:hypothetical protein [Tanacetum cinerariifolium]
MSHSSVEDRYQPHLMVLGMTKCIFEATCSMSLLPWLSYLENGLSSKPMVIFCLRVRIRIAAMMILLLLCIYDFETMMSRWTVLGATQPYVGEASLNYVCIHGGSGTLSQVLWSQIGAKAALFICHSSELQWTGVFLAMMILLLFCTTVSCKTILGATQPYLSVASLYCVCNHSRSEMNRGDVTETINIHWVCNLGWYYDICAFLIDNGVSKRHVSCQDNTSKVRFAAME